MILRNYVSRRSIVPRRTMVRNYVTRRTFVSRRTMVRNYVRRDVDILRHTPSLTHKVPELVSKKVLSIPVYICVWCGVCACVRTSVRPCVCACAGACARARARVCVCVCVYRMLNLRLRFSGDFSTTDFFALHFIVLFNITSG